jgi:hypothetical protein
MTPPRPPNHRPRAASRSPRNRKRIPARPHVLPGPAAWFRQVTAALAALGAAQLVFLKFAYRRRSIIVITRRRRRFSAFGDGHGRLRLAPIPVSSRAAHAVRACISAARDI